MSFTRNWFSGGELQNVNELNEYGGIGTTSATISSTVARNGNYSFRFVNSSRPRGRSATFTELRSCAAMYHNGNGGSTSVDVALICWIPCTGITSGIWAQWKATTGLEIYVGGTLQTTLPITTNNFSNTGTWHTIGVAYKAHSSTGFFSLYINGVLAYTFTGNTGTQANGVFYGGQGGSTGNGWANYMYLDDFYVDSASGESDAIPPSYGFGWSPASAAGTSAAWTATGATPNYACVDDTGAPNDDTDYVSATSAGLIDYYATTNITVPTGYAVNALIPTVWAKKTDTAIASQIKCGARLSGSNTTNTAQSMSTTYGMIFERHATKPGGGTWNETDVNNSEMMIESAGTF